MRILLSGVLLPIVLFFSIVASSHTENSPNKLTIHADLRALMLREGYQEIPIFWSKESKTLLIKAAFTTGQSQWFILDSGAVVTTIDPKIVSTQQLTVSKDNIILNGSDNSHQTAYKVTIPQLTLSGFVTYNNNAYVADRSFIKNSSEPVVGTLGLDFLYSHLAILDIADHRLYLKQGVGGFKSAENLRYKLMLETAGYQSFVFKHATTGNQMLMAGINQTTPVAFIVDSGSPFTMLSLNYARSLDLKIKSTAQQGTGSGGKLITIFSTNAKQLAIEKLHWSLPEIAAINFNFIDANTPMHGILGADWLEKGQAILDFAGDRIYTKA